jgi:hypothetical protein
MKTTRLIYLFTGWICILINSIGYLAIIGLPQPYFRNKSILYIFGFNFWFAAGLVLLYLAMRLKRKLKKYCNQNELDSF